MSANLRPSLVPDTTPRYGELSDRAVNVVAGRADGVPDDELAEALFGAAAGDRWASLLTTILGRDARLVRQEDRWFSAETTQEGGRALAHAHDTGLLLPLPTDALADLGTVTTLALATTGADPRRHRIARIAVVQRADGEIVARFDAVMQPERRYAQFVMDAARVVEEDLDAAPIFAEIVPQLRELVDAGPVYVYGATRTRAFLAAECRRADLPPMAWKLYELDELLGAELTAERKPGLRAAASILGIPVPDRASPLAEADLTGRIIERLRQRQAASPPRAALPATDDETDAAAPTLLPFTQAWAAHVPEGPGVYIVEDAQGQALYIGKAVALRRRLAAYVQRQPALHRQLEALGVRAAHVSTVETRSDLEATLLEARMIRERQPAFNVARQTRPPAVIVRAAPDAKSPRVQLVSHVAADGADGARYFGPFESVRAAQQLVSMARAAFPAAFPRRRGDVARQRAAVLDVCRLLSGQKEPARQALQTAMRAAASGGDPSAVSRLREALRSVQALDIRPSILAGLSGGWRLCVVEQLANGRRRGHLLQDGRLVASHDLRHSYCAVDCTARTAFPAHPHDAPATDDPVPSWTGSPDHLSPSHESNFLAPDSCGCTAVPGGWDAASPPSILTGHDGVEDADERAIVLRWLTQARGRITLHRLPAADATAD